MYKSIVYENSLCIKCWIPDIDENKLMLNYILVEHTMKLNRKISKEK